MTDKTFMRADEVAEELDVLKPVPEQRLASSSDTSSVRMTAMKI